MAKVIKFNFFQPLVPRHIFDVKDVIKIFNFLVTWSIFENIRHYISVSLLLCREEIGIPSAKEEHGMMV